MTPDIKAARELEQNAQVIARRSCFHLITTYSDLESGFGADAQKIWTEHLHERIQEISTAIAAGDYNLFANQIEWSRQALEYRELKPDELYKSLESLRAGVEQSLEGDTQRTVMECIDVALASRFQNIGKALGSQLDAGMEHDRLALLYLQSVLSGNSAEGMQIVIDAVDHGLSVRDAYLNVLLPAQQEVGRLWHAHDLTITEEHLVSYTTQRLMAVLADRAECRSDNGLTMLAGTVADNPHDMGIRAVSYLFEFNGWRTIYLGSDLPRSELPAAIEIFEVDLVCLSVALPSQIPAARRSIEEIHHKCTRPTQVMLGGNGLVNAPELWKELGADGYARTADEALQMGLELAQKTRPAGLSSEQTFKAVK